MLRGAVERVEVAPEVAGYAVESSSNGRTRACLWAQPARPACAGERARALASQWPGLRDTRTRQTGCAGGAAHGSCRNPRVPGSGRPRREGIVAKFSVRCACPIDSSSQAVRVSADEVSATRCRRSPRWKVKLSLRIGPPRSRDLFIIAGIADHPPYGSLRWCSRRSRSPGHGRA